MYTFKMLFKMSLLCFQQNKPDVIIMVALMAFYLLNIKCRIETAKIKQYVEYILSIFLSAPIYKQKNTFLQIVKVE